MNAQKQDFEKLFKTELQSFRFEISEEQLQLFRPIWFRVLETSSLLELDTDVETHTELMNQLLFPDHPTFNLYNVSCLINTLTKKSPNDLGIVVSEYNKLIKESLELANRWNEIVLPIRDKLVNKIQTQQALQMPKNGMNVIPGRR